MIKVNGYPIEIKKFPNGESLIKRNFVYKGDIIKAFNISLKFESNDDLMHLAMIKHEIDEVGGIADLQLPYVPYSRMDRTEGENVFTLKTICKFINSLNFKQVYILEPHSDVCVALLDRVVSHEYTTGRLLPKVISDNNLYYENDYLVFPDSGAEKRYAKRVEYKNILTAIKHRDFTTGEIKSLEVIGKAKEGFNAIIVDDLCSKGGTFMLTANKLKEMGANKIYLAVTHCESTILDGDVLKYDSPIEKVYTTNSIINESYLRLAKPQFELCFGKKVDINKLYVESVF